MIYLSSPKPRNNSINRISYYSIELGNETVVTILNCHRRALGIDSEAIRKGWQKRKG